MTLPHKKIIKHIACLLNIEEEEVCCQFPTVHSLLPIDRSPSTPTSVLTPDTLMLAHTSTMFNDVNDYEGIILPPTLSYPRTELEHYIEPNYPNSPPISSPKPLPVPPPHFHDSMLITPPMTSATNSTYTLPVIPAFIEDVPSCSPSPISPMAIVLYQQCHRLPPSLPNLSLPFSYSIPDRSFLAYLIYLWTVLVFSRDFHTIPLASTSFYDLPSPSTTFQ